jgi:uncharacterized protein (UPF0333 family)
MKNIKTIILILIVLVIVAGLGAYFLIHPQTSSQTGTPTTTSPVAANTSNIQQLNAPESVSLQQGGIAEIRNENFYFTMQSLSSSSATIQITPVGCWNSFPSDTPPQIRCMIAIVPIPPQTLYVGQTYSTANYGIKLTQIINGTAMFSASVSSAS